MKLSFRPHHFLCTLGFQGKGYSPEFIKNYTQVVEGLQENEELPIEVVASNDSICQACPHKGVTRCRQEEKIHLLDTRHSQVLSIFPGDHLTWKEGKERLKKKMTMEAFHQACAGCQWKSLGVCETALVNLRTQAS
jgi:hypothetical protein